MFKDAFKGKKIVITGHTGFKGSWLTLWLLQLGAEICGISDRIPTKPSLFQTLCLENKIEHHFCDVCDLEKLDKIITNFKPNFLFHLAAQAVVSVSYEQPLETLTTNVIGTANILECLRKLDQSCATVLVTSDKCYENVEWEWGYKETDALGGKDIYSGSKGAAEIVFHAYQCSFFNDVNIRLASARAGNVIGGGDWTKDRIVVDCIESWVKGQAVTLRSPNATRPWQHVLEPLSGYLTLAAALNETSNLNGEAFNFGPRSEQNRSVLELITDLSKLWKLEPDQAVKISNEIPFHEASLLKLNCDKALFHLKWQANLNYQQSVTLVGSWYHMFYKGKDDIYDFTVEQLNQYIKIAKEQNLIWTH